MKKRIKVSFTQQSKQTVADTTVEYVVEEGEGRERFINADVLKEAKELQDAAQKEAATLSMKYL